MSASPNSLFDRVIPEPRWGLVVPIKRKPKWVPKPMWRPKDA